jgi:O-antigen/teichoic acid export membrane protein
MLRKLGNLTLLIGGYGLGQGSLFLAQTWLVIHAHLPRFTEFGLGFYTATLALLLVDFGSTQFLAREIAHHGEAEEAKAAAWISYWRITPVRLAAAVACLIAGLVYARFSGPFSAAYLLFGSPALLIWAFNAAGPLDGFRLSGASGLTGSLPCITSSIALIATTGMPSAESGAILGASLSVGYILAVAAQLGVLTVTGRRPRFAAPSWANVVDSSVHSGAAMLTLLPGQLYFRLQLAVCAIFLTPAATAIFLYAKQIVTAISQLIGFIRRVEFADMVAALAKRDHSPLRVILVSQRLGTAIGAVSALCVGLFGLGLHFVGTGTPQAGGIAIAAFAPTILTAALALGFTQGQMALRRFHVAAIVSIAAISLSAVVTLVLVPGFGVVGLAMADFLGNTVTIVASIILLSKIARPLPEAQCAS